MGTRYKGNITITIATTTKTVPQRVCIPKYM